MSLTKLFNLKYFKENLKKSKSVLFLLFVIVPMFTVLQLMNDTSVDVYSYPLLGVINMIAMALIPFMLSQTLFGYVYKRKSVDFIGSMPISRKTIFTTNTIGGVFLIIFMQFVTFILTLITSQFISATVFSKLAFDVFVYQSIAYIFIFCLSNLAMSFSGNLMTQLIVTILFFAIYPVLNAYITESGGSIVNIGNLGINIVRSYNYFTIPIMVIANSGKVAAISIVKTIILSIIYSIIGLYLFTKRKMEKAGESFSYELTHFIIKGLTLIPFVIFINEMVTYADFSEIYLIGGIILVYWYVYDLITAKKIKIYKSVLALITSFIALIIFINVGISIAEKRTENIDIDDIKYVIIEDDSYYTVPMYSINSSIDSLNKSNYDKNKIYKITKKEDIEKIFGYIRKNSNSIEKYEDKDLESETVNNAKILYDCCLNSYINKYDYIYCYTFIDKELMNEIIKNAEIIEEKNVIMDNAVLGNKFETMTNEEEKRILEIVKTLEPTRIRKNQEYLSSNIDTLYVHQYVDHEIKTYEYAVNSNEELKVLFDKINQREMKYLLENRKDHIGNFEVTSKLRPNSTRKDVSYYLGYAESEKFAEFLLNNFDNEEVDYSKDIMNIELRLRRNYDRIVTIKTNDYDGIISELVRIGAINNYSEKEYYYDMYYNEVITEPTSDVEQVIIYEGEENLIQEVY